MTMHRLALPLAAAVLALCAGAASSQTTATAGDSVRGKKIYASYGCYQCHGYQGQGSNAGPKLAPGPLPFEALDRQLRKPRDRMPVYTQATTSGQDVADIYAYL